MTKARRFFWKYLTIFFALNIVLCFWYFNWALATPSNHQQDIVQLFEKWEFLNYFKARGVKTTEGTSSTGRAPASGFEFVIAFILFVFSLRKWFKATDDHEFEKSKKSKSAPSVSSTHRYASANSKPPVVPIYERGFQSRSNKPAPVPSESKKSKAETKTSLPVIKPNTPNKSTKTPIGTSDVPKNVSDVASTDSKLTVESLEVFFNGFLELVNKSNGVVATREALLQAFACAEAADSQMSELWMASIFGTYDRMIEPTVGNGDFETAANIAMWHGVVRSIFGKGNIDQTFVQALELCKGFNDPVFVARCHEEYSWALEAENRTQAFQTQSQKAEDAFRSYGRSDRADEIVRIRNGGERFGSSFLQRKKLVPEATSVLGSSDARKMRLSLK
jgi:hypothetical protein